MHFNHPLDAFQLTAINLRPRQNRVLHGESEPNVNGGDKLCQMADA